MIFLVIITYCIFFTSKNSGRHLILDKRRLESLTKDQFHHIKQNYSFYRAYIIYRNYGQNFDIEKVERTKMEEEVQRLSDLASVIKNKKIRYTEYDLSDDSSSTDSDPGQEQNPFSINQGKNEKLFAPNGRSSIDPRNL